MWFVKVNLKIKYKLKAGYFSLKRDTWKLLLKAVHNYITRYFRTVTLLYLIKTCYISILQFSIANDKGNVFIILTFHLKRQCKVIYISACKWYYTTKWKYVFTWHFICHRNKGDIHNFPIYHDYNDDNLFSKCD